MNSVEIQDKKLNLRNRCEEIINLCKTEIREMTEDEQKEFDDAKEEIKNLNTQLRELKEKLENYSEELPKDDEVKEENKINENNKRSKEIMNSNFRLIKAINDIANSRSLDEVASAVNHKGNEEMRKAGLSYGGQIQLPVQELRDVVVNGDDGVHGDLVATDIYNILEPLRANSVLAKAGAKYLTGLVGDVQVPVMGKSNVAWAGETADATSGDPAFDHVTLQPKRLTAYVNLSKQFLNQDSVDAESVIRQDIIRAINDKLEATILGTASGSTTQPDGLLAGAATSANTFAKLVDVEASLEEKDVNDYTYILSPKAKAGFRAMAKGTGDGLVYTNGEVDGVNAEVTSNVASKKFIVGDFKDLAIGQWGAINYAWVNN